MCAASDDVEELRKYLELELLKRISADMQMATHIGQLIDEVRKLQERVDALEKTAISLENIAHSHA